MRHRRRKSQAASTAASPAPCAPPPCATVARAAGGGAIRATLESLLVAEIEHHMDSPVFSPASESPPQHINALADDTHGAHAGTALEDPLPHPHSRATHPQGHQARNTEDSHANSEHSLRHASETLNDSSGVVAPVLPPPTATGAEPPPGGGHEQQHTTTGAETPGGDEQQLPPVAAYQRAIVRSMLGLAGVVTMRLPRLPIIRPPTTPTAPPSHSHSGSGSGSYHASDSDRDSDSDSDRSCRPSGAEPTHSSPLVATSASSGAPVGATARDAGPVTGGNCTASSASHDRVSGAFSFSDSVQQEHEHGHQHPNPKHYENQQQGLVYKHTELDSPGTSMNPGTLNTGGKHNIGVSSGAARDAAAAHTVAQVSGFSPEGYAQLLRKVVSGEYLLGESDELHSDDERGDGGAGGAALHSVALSGAAGEEERARDAGCELLLALCLEAFTDLCRYPR